MTKISRARAQKNIADKIVYFEQLNAEDGNSIIAIALAVSEWGCAYRYYFYSDSTFSFNILLDTSIDIDNAKFFPIK